MSTDPITDTGGLADTGVVTFGLDGATLTFGGTPITVNHVSGSGAGDGSFGNPHGSLTDADLDPNKSDRDIVYVYSGATFTNQDFHLVFFLVTGLGFALFVTTSLWGRLWCGFVCPQSVFMEGVVRCSIGTASRRSYELFYAAGADGPRAVFGETPREA